MADVNMRERIPKLSELGSDNLIWVPLTSVPIDERYGINSMRQPALKVFQLLCWSDTGEREYLRKLALKHKEMGYYLLHFKDVFGIIGVREYQNGWTPGRAAIFNGSESYYQKKNIVELKLVYSELKYPCGTLRYELGRLSNFDTIIHDTGCTVPIDLDDD